MTQDQSDAQQQVEGLIPVLGLSGLTGLRGLIKMQDIFLVLF